MFIKVDLPEPDAPTMATISPASMVRLMSFKTAIVWSPAGNSRRTPESEINGPLMSGSRRRAGLRRSRRRRGVRRHDALAHLKSFQHLRLHVVVHADLDVAHLGLVVF